MGKVEADRNSTLDNALGRATGTTNEVDISPIRHQSKELVKLHLQAQI